MRLKNWEWLNYISASAIMAVGVFFLLKPWLNFFYQMRIDYISIFQQLWIVFTIIFTAIMARILMRIENNFLRLFLVAFFITVNIFFIYYTGWKLRYFIIVLLIAVTLGLRFEMYFGGSNFNTDFGFAILFLIFSLLLNNRYTLGLKFLNIIIIFVSGIILSTYFNFNINGNRDKYKIIFSIALLSILSAFIIVFLTPGVVSLISNSSSFLIDIYFKLVDIFIFIIYPLVWLINPIYKYILHLINKFSVNSLEQPARSGESTGLEEIIRQAEKTQNVTGEFHLWWLYIILGLIVIYLTLKLWKLSRNDEEEGFREERESLLTKKTLKKDFQQFINKIKNPFKPAKRKNLYDRRSQSIIIREIYYKFLVRFNQYKPSHRSDTPNNYYYILSNSGYIVNEEDYVKTLTDIYNKTRYGGDVQSRDVEKAREIWHKIAGE